MTDEMKAKIKEKIAAAKAKKGEQATEAEPIQINSSTSMTSKAESGC